MARRDQKQLFSHFGPSDFMPLIPEEHDTNSLIPSEIQLSENTSILPIEGPHLNLMTSGYEPENSVILSSSFFWAIINEMSQKNYSSTAQEAPRQFTIKSADHAVTKPFTMSSWNSQASNQGAIEKASIAPELLESLKEDTQLFELALQPKNYQRKSYPMCPRCIRPNPLLLGLKPQFKSLRDFVISPTASVSLVAESGADLDEALASSLQPSKNKSLKVNLSSDLVASFYLQIFETSANQAVRLRFLVEYRLKKSPRTEIILSSPFIVLSNQPGRVKKKTKTNESEN